MKFLSAQQLAFVLDIKVAEAKDKIIVAYCKEHGQSVPTSKAKKQRKEESKDYPNVLPIETLSKHLGLPDLQFMVDDIHNNYLKRSATKKYILCDYPEKHIKACLEKGVKKKLSVPPALRTMLKAEDLAEIENKWKERYVKWFSVNEE